MSALKLADLAVDECGRRLGRGGLALRLDPFVVRIESPYRRVRDEIMRFYAERDVDHGGFADFHVRVAPTGTLRRFLRRQCCFSLDGERPFLPLPAEQAFLALEWGLNWAIANRAHDYLVVHAAVLARGGDAIVLPGPPGSGKTTLAAALMVGGWRLLSDELMLMEVATGNLWPLVRPLNLKNDSIGLVRQLDAVLTYGPEVSGTVKGRVCHVGADAASAAACRRPARLRWLVVPALNPNVSAPSLAQRTRAEGLLLLFKNSFNATVLGERAFEAAGAALDRASVFDFEYFDLDAAVAFLGRELGKGAARAG